MTVPVCRTAEGWRLVISASQDEAGGFTVEVANLGGWKEPEPGNVGHGLSVMNELMSEVAIRR